MILETENWNYMWWMLCVLFYGVSKGIREIMKKLALKKHTVIEVLFVYTFISFLLVLPQAPKAGGLEGADYFYVALKSFSIFLAWICSFKAIRKLPISLYGVLDLSRVLFATFLGVAILGEILNPFQMFGLIFVCGGLLLLKFKPKFLKRFFGDSNIEEKEEAADTKEKNAGSEKVGLYVFLAFLSCVLNAFSGMMDKILMKDLSSMQLQFWYMLFLVGFYLIYVLVTRTKIRWKTWLNGWIWILSILFVLADQALFIANGMAESRVTVMTLIKQSGCIVTILGGRLIFEEKGTAYKMFCAAVIVIGIVIGVMG